jgi:hypothetical protein
MKKTIMLILVVIFSVLMFQLSCASMKEDAGEAAEASAEAEMSGGGGSVAGVMLLADTHEAAGSSCSDCHAEDPPSGNVPTDTCLTCHEDYKDLAASYLDPHNAHVTYSNCSDCHHVHRESEKICQGCHHTFNVQAP